MPINTVAKTFNTLAQHIDAYDPNSLNSDKISKTLKLSEQFLAGFKQFPDVFVAQTQLYKSKNSFTHNLAFNSLAYCSLLCQQLKINDLCCQQLLSAIISLYAERNQQLIDYYIEQGTTPTSFKHIKLLKMLASVNQQTWLNAYSVARYLFIGSISLGKWPQTLSKIQRVVYLAHYLAVASTSHQRFKARPFGEVMKNAVQSCPPTWLEMLSVLIDYPSLIPPGSLLKTQNNTSGMVLSVSDNRVLIAQLASGERQQPLLLRIEKQNIKRISAPQGVNGFNQMLNWWNDAWLLERDEFSPPKDDYFALDKPPMVLLEVQEQLNSGDVDIDKLAMKISDEPAFGDYLKATATLSNRHKQPVNQVKHGLMMHGYERTNNMLIELALLLRLNQSYFPLQQNFTQFTKLTCAIAASIASLGNTVIAQQASNLACFTCSGLFTQPSLKTRTQWTTGTADFFDIRTLFDFSNAQNLLTHPLKLCKAWQQPSIFTQAISSHMLLPDLNDQEKLTKTLAVIIGLSLIIARQCFFGEEITCSNSTTYQQQALAFLGLTELDSITLQQQGLANSHCYWELP
ncbi:hypothetical protein [Aliiglaciecola sp. LCG003]|uniref:hypothetical protein n=1 Tax=Aliiglaciecola sp. LCG003 TaxID=3053655 RepID=UPI00257299FB|nr:hypothetical protein [Aliiglaciecola sp. LCG003]WJG10415.1 hypothetical protein QR722_05080 [Aliiglaciecola sp. LCG003]